MGDDSRIEVSRHGRFLVGHRALVLSPGDRRPLYISKEIRRSKDSFQLALDEATWWKNENDCPQGIAIAQAVYDRI